MSVSLLTPVALLFALVPSAVFLLLFLAARRGRRADDHPVCRACRFDLVGVYPGRATCPECGADLSAAHSVRVGNRVRRTRLAAFSLVMLLLSLTLVGATLSGSISHRGVASILPGRLLLSLAERAGPLRSPWLDELYVRSIDGRLGAVERDRLAQTALAMQSDRASSTDNQWLAIVTRMIEDGAGTPADTVRGVRQGLTLRLTHRGSTPGGTLGPFTLVADADRLTSLLDVVIVPELLEATTDGVPMLAEPLPFAAFELDPRMPQRVVYTLAPNSPSGVAALSLRWRFRVHRGTLTDHASEPLGEWEQALDSTLVISAPEAGTK
ncbi:MAG: hypothetical protein JNM07_04980 [Phycisphaerae bacterium]|nr:hypothetical protein [Phycisphaerae bacterium]